VRVQGTGAVDIPTHLVDQTQWLVDGAGDAAGEAPRLLSARGWYTRVPSGAFRRITGEATFPAALAPFMDGDALGYLCNVEMSYRIAGVTARVGARWELFAPPDGGDTYRAVARGTRGTVVLEQGPETGGRRRLFVEPRGEMEPALQALGAAVAGWQTELPGVGIERDEPGIDRHRHPARTVGRARGALCDRAGRAAPGRRRRRVARRAGRAHAGEVRAPRRGGCRGVAPVRLIACRRVTLAPVQRRTGNVNGFPWRIGLAACLGVLLLAAGGRAVSQPRARSPRRRSGTSW
jgi:hypothetical protein